MKKELNGSELAGFVKERQLHAVRGLRQESGVIPKLAIIRTNPEPIVDSYMRIKQQYGEDIQVEVEVHTIEQSEALALIQKLNVDATVHGIIVQLPLPNREQTTEILDAVNSAKDVDGLAIDSAFDTPTPVAINWLLAGYNIDLKNSEIVIVGNGRLVGKPLAKMWRNSGYQVTVADRKTGDLSALTNSADIIVSAVGAPGLITESMIAADAVIVDAGVSTDSNGLIGDVADTVRKMPDIKMTPLKGGVGPLTVAALFENVILAARRQSD